MNYSELLSEYSLPLILLLVTSFITIRVQHYKRNKNCFDKEFSEFRIVFADFATTLWNEELTLERIILDNFDSHKKAMNRFIHNLKGKRRSAFYRKWNEYQIYYENAKSLGSIVDMTSVAPPHIELKDVTTTDILEYDFSRRKNIHGILNDLIEIANKPIRY